MDARAATALRHAAGLHAAGKLDDALTLYQDLLRWDPQNWQAIYFSGLIALQTSRPAQAADLFAKTLLLSDDVAEIHLQLGVALSQLQRHQEALESYHRAIALNPTEALLHEQRGHACLALRLFEDAAASFGRAIELAPARHSAYIGRGTAHFYLRRMSRALMDYDRALSLNPHDPIAYNNRGNIRREIRQLEAALSDYDSALALRRDYADACFNRGNVLRELHRYEAAIADFDTAANLEPALKTVQALRFYTRRQICAWGDSSGPTADLESMLDRKLALANPFFVLALTHSAERQQRTAVEWVGHAYPPALAPRLAYARRERIRLAYCSADFHAHATMHLMAELFELHDRKRFEVLLISFGSDSNDEMRRRLKSTGHEFVDVKTLSDGEITELLRGREIDIAIDLKGFTENHRARIFATRAAPLQVSYLGYPGTMGASYMDYLVADRTLIPAGSERHYCEKIIYLPGSYQVNDRQRSIDAKPVRRDEHGLPPEGFVFCCFNSVYKISPSTFDVWMRILGRVAGSVLWLLRDNQQAVQNLRCAAARRGIAPDRLVFADPVALPKHLARQRLADLFLDTLPCNAHTTASDALWAGVPLLTQAGEAFAGRVAASLLMAVGLPELIVSTEAEYEARAVELACQPELLAPLRARLAAARATCPLFDAPRFTRHLESAYVTIYERHHAGHPPAAIEVPS
jgi:predicted O-linked N-acetylglucosamine transferase (SPINDLY family)